MEILPAFKNGTSKQAELVSQAQVRTIICSFMGGYYLLFGIANHPVYIVFVLYSLSLLLVAQRKSIRSHLSPTITLLADNGFSICGLHVTGESGTFLLFFLIHISFAYGLRFGRLYLLMSLLVSCAGVSWLYFYSFPWQGRIHFLLSFLFGMPFISLYVYALTDRVRVSELDARESQSRTRKLLAFLTHDVRAPLQNIQEATNRLRSEPLSESGRQSVMAIERTIAFLARMTSNALATNNMPFTAISTNKESSLAHAGMESLSVSIVRLFEVFRGSIEARGASLSYEFLGDIDSISNDSVIKAERIFVNILSNAIRYCDDGFVLVRVQEADANPKVLRITIENSVSNNSTGMSSRVGDTTSLRRYLSGTGLGLKAAQDTALEIGVKISVSGPHSGRYSSIVDFTPVPTAPSKGILIQTPVVTISSDPSDWIHAREQIAESANVFWMPAIESTISNDGGNRDFSNAIFLCTEDAITDHRTLSEEVSKVGGRIVCVTGNGSRQQDLIVLDGTKIWLQKGSPAKAWASAVALADAFISDAKYDVCKWKNADVDLAGKRVLALDDNLLNLSMLTVKLQRIGMDVKSVSSIRSARDELKRSRYDLIVADWNIGLETSAELLRNLVTDPLYSGIRLLILSGDDPAIESDELLNSRNIKRLQKPVPETLMISAIRESLSLSDWRDSPAMAQAPSNIFNCDWDSWSNLENSFAEVTSVLLTDFLAELEEAVERIQHSLYDGTVCVGEHELHRLASMCYSAGAHWVGDAFAEMRHRVVGSPDVANAYVGQKLPTITAMISATKGHIGWYLRTIKAHSAKAKVN